MPNAFTSGHRTLYLTYMYLLCCSFQVACLLAPGLGWAGLGWAGLVGVCVCVVLANVARRSRYVGTLPPTS